MTDAGQTFDALVSGMDYPMLIVTAATEKARAGCLVGFASQASIDPPRFLACLSRANRTYRVARVSDALAVHFVPAEAAGLAELFGGQTGDDVDKFDRCSWHEGPEGLPILDDCESWFAGRVLERFDLGDHVGFLLEPIAASAGPGTRERPFTFHRARPMQPGHPA